MSKTLQLQPLAFDLPVHLNIHLENVTVTDEGGQKWIKGEVNVHADAFGKNLDTKIPFKTLNATAVNLPLPVGGANIDLTVTLKDPHQVCANAKLNWGPLHPSTGEQCIAI